MLAIPAIYASEYQIAFHLLVLRMCNCQSVQVIGARARYSTALPHLLLFIIFFISHVYYICYFLLSMYGHQGNAGTLSHVISVKLPKTVISFYIQSCSRTTSCIRQTAFSPMFRTLSFKDSMTLFLFISKYPDPGLWDFKL